MLVVLHLLFKRFYTNIRLEMFKKSGAISIVQRFCARFFAIISDGD